MDNFLVNFFKDMYNKINTRSSNIEVSKETAIDSVSDLKLVIQQLITSFSDIKTNAELLKNLNTLTTDNSPIGYAVNSYKTILKSSVVKVKTMEQSQPLSSIIYVLNNIVRDLEIIESQYNYILGSPGKRNLSLEDMKLSTAIVVGYLRHVVEFQDWCFNFFAGLTSEKGSDTFLKYQGIELSNKTSCSNVSLFINSIVTRKPSETIWVSINKLKNTKNDLYLKIGDKTIDEYMPTNVLSEFETYLVSGFVSTVDDLVDEKGFSNNIIIGTGRWILNLWKIRYERNKEIRNFLSARVDALNTDSSNETDEVELQKINKAIVTYTNKIAEYSKRISRYEAQI